MVATSNDQHTVLDNIAARCRSNGIQDLKVFNKSEVKSLEENVDCTKALLIPETAIFDVHSYVGSLQNDCEENSVDFVFNCKFLSAHCKSSSSGGFVISTNQGDIEASGWFRLSGYFIYL